MVHSNKIEYGNTENSENKTRNPHFLKTPNGESAIKKKIGHGHRENSENT